jgi:hypothetical protein
MSATRMGIYLSIFSIRVVHSKKILLELNTPTTFKFVLRYHLGSQTRKIKKKLLLYNDLERTKNDDTNYGFAQIHS